VVERQDPDPAAHPAEQRPEDLPGRRDGLGPGQRQEQGQAGAGELGDDDDPEQWSAPGSDPAAEVARAPAQGRQEPEDDDAQGGPPAPSRAVGPVSSTSASPAESKRFEAVR